MSGALAGVIGLAAGWAWACLAAASFLAAYLLRGRERGVVRVCHRAVSIMARESVCWLVAANGWGVCLPRRRSVFSCRAFGF